MTETPAKASKAKMTRSFPESMEVIEVEMSDRLDELNRQSFDAIQLRFYLAGLLIRMPYGTTKIVTEEQAQKAWPPTGDHAPSTFENTFRALALANGGHRPETSYTTQERIINDLDDSFDVKQDVITGDWYVRRYADACPHCHGRKFVQRRAPMALSTLTFDDTVSEQTVSKIETTPCDCKPARD